VKTILDPSFVYTNANNTDIRKTFERVRAEMRKPETESENFRLEEDVEREEGKGEQ